MLITLTSCRMDSTSKQPLNILMETIISIIGLLVLIAFIILTENVKKIKNRQEMIYKVLADQSNLLSEQITIMKGEYKPDNNG
jgi:hypothetical protein